MLTLQDISGKPLQSALLASSSGGVGKDVLHSNSLRSLNSPVMSQLNGQSSTSRKTLGGGGGSGVGSGSGGGQEAQGRTSSLVSTLDAVSSSSVSPPLPPPGSPMHLYNQYDGDGSTTTTTTDERGNDSYTCSKIEYDDTSVSNDKARKQNYDFDSSLEDHLLHW